MDMQEKSVLVTGGGSGIGAGLAEEMDRRGAPVTGGGRRAAGLEAVAGRGSGIGAGMAEELARGGGLVTIVGRRADRLDEVAGRSGEETGRAGTVHAHVADVTDEDAVAGAVGAAMEHGGGLDGVVACAGGS